MHHSHRPTRVGSSLEVEVSRHDFKDDSGELEPYRQPQPARYAHTATVLANGKILVVGGESWIDGFFKGLLTSAELYDPLTAKWTITGSLNKARASHTATLLPNGKVLVVGGDGSTFNISSTSSTELYDPATGTWSVAGNLEFVRVGHTATLLPNGKALIVGGNQDTGQNAEVYDPRSARG